MDTKNVNLKELWNNKIVQFIFNIIIGLSTASLTFILIEQVLVAEKEWIYIVLPCISFIIVEILAFKFEVLKQVFKELKKSLFIVSIILAMVTAYTIYMQGDYTSMLQIIKVCILISIPAITIMLYWFYNKFLSYIKKYFKSLDRVEKNYLRVIIPIFVLIIIIVYHLTTVFSTTKVEKKDFKYVVSSEQYYKEHKDIVEKIVENVYRTMLYDTLYTSDTGPLINSQDVYMNISKPDNSLKQPLFGLISIPFSVVPKMISYIIPWDTNIYGTLLAIIQGILMFISFTLLARMMKLKGGAKAFFLIIISSLFSTLFFLLNLEQYLLPMFYLICFIYFSFENLKDKDILYIMATGGMLTSGIVFPLLFSCENWKENIKNIFYTLLKCIVIFTICARILLVFPEELYKQVKGISQFATSTKYTVNETVNMYTNFVKNIFYFSEFEIRERLAGKQFLFLNKEPINFVIESYCIQAKDTTQFSIVGTICRNFSNFRLYFQQKRQTFTNSLWMVFIFSIFVSFYGMGS